MKHCQYIERTDNQGDNRMYVIVSTLLVWIHYIVVRLYTMTVIFTWVTCLRLCVLV